MYSSFLSERTVERILEFSLGIEESLVGTLRLARAV